MLKITKNIGIKDIYGTIGFLLYISYCREEDIPTYRFLSLSAKLPSMPIPFNGALQTAPYRFSIKLINSYPQHFNNFKSKVFKTNVVGDPMSRAFIQSEKSFKVDSSRLYF